MVFEQLTLCLQPGVHLNKPQRPLNLIPPLTTILNLAPPGQHSTTWLGSFPHSIRALSRVTTDKKGAMLMSAQTEENRVEKDQTG